MGEKSTLVDFFSIECRKINNICLLKFGDNIVYSNFLSKFRKYLKKAKQVHDTAFMNVEWDLNMKTPPPKTNEKAYFRTQESKLQEESLALEAKRINSEYSNILPKGSIWDNTTTHYVMAKQEALFRRRIQKLCRDTVSISHHHFGGGAFR